MSNGKQEMIRASPGPQIAQREGDRQTMLSALGRVKARTAGMARKTAETAMRKRKRTSKKR